MKRLILIVDDEAGIRTTISDVLKDEGYDTIQAASAEEASELLKKTRPDLVLLDVWLHGMDGLTFLSRLRLTQPNIPIIIISGHGNTDTAVQAIQRGAYDFLEKPFQSSRLLLSLKNALDKKELHRENLYLKSQVELNAFLWGNASVMQDLKRRVKKTGYNHSHTLILGEDGTGKQTLAQHIHKRSSNKRDNFAILNCANLSAHTFEKELWGEHDSSTGKQISGILERAHGGTLFLKSVHKMPLVAQAKIMRIFHEDTFTPIGGNIPYTSKFQIIASSIPELPQQVSAGHFREDFYTRLSVVKLEIPPLRERLEDLEELAFHCLELESAKLGRTFNKLVLNREQLNIFRKYHWPGNLDELRNATGRLLILKSGYALEQSNHVSEFFPEVISSPQKQNDIMDLPLRKAREEFEKNYLETQIAKFGGNIQRTAQFIEMERSALHRKIRCLKLPKTKNISSKK
jgi:two-component system nitrogen regulation response regulator NtrX